MKYNMNRTVKVILTPTGKRVLKNKLSNEINELRKFDCSSDVLACVTIKMSPNSDNSFECQLWKLFEIFGSEMGMGMDVPFLDNEIIFE